MNSRNGKIVAICILVIVAIIILLYSSVVLPDLPEARIPVKPVSLNLALNKTNNWTDQKVVFLNYHNLFIENFTVITDSVENILSVTISANKIDPQRIDILANGSMLSMQGENRTYYGKVIVQDKDYNRNITIIDVIIDFQPLLNYGISMDTDTVRLTLNSTGNSTDHETISITNPLQRKLTYTINSFDSSLTSNLESIVDIDIYPGNYAQRISIDADNMDDNSKAILYSADKERTYYGYIEILLEGSTTVVGVIDLRIDVVK